MRHGNLWPRRGEEGAALVEFALILPLAALILFGLIDFGFIYQSYSQLRNGVQAGARLASTNSTGYAPPPSCAVNPGTGTATDTGTTNLVCAILGKINPPLTGMSDTFTLGIAFDSPTTANTTGQEDIVVCAAGRLNSTTGLLAKLFLGSQMSASTTILANTATAQLNFEPYVLGDNSITYGSVTVSGMNC